MANVNLIKRINDLMYKDKGVNGSAQRLSQLVWLLFLKVFDYKEESNELEDNYMSKIPEKYRWRDWANPENVRDALTGDSLIEFVDTELLPVLRGLPIKIVDEKGVLSEVILFDKTDDLSLLVKVFMQDSINYMKNGVYLRQVINILNEVDFSDGVEQHSFNTIYEDLLKDLQAAKGDGGEFYTPRALTTLITEKCNPKPGEKVADFACGTGGFLIDALIHMEKQLKYGDTEKQNSIHKSLLGIEYKPLPYMLCVTNLLLHRVNTPNIQYKSAFEERYSSYTDKDMVDVILMNPPYGGTTTDADKLNFPVDLRTSESYGLFMALILKRLKRNGRAGVIIPDGFLFGNDNASINLKEKLFKECNVHTLLRMPGSCFAPYTNITTNIIFFDKTGSTKEMWVYRFDLPNNQKFSKSKNPITREKLNSIDEWWENRIEIEDEKSHDSATLTYKSKCYSISEIRNMNYYIDLCGYINQEEEILEPKELIQNYYEERYRLNTEIDEVLEQIIDVLGIEINGGIKL